MSLDDLARGFLGSIAEPRRVVLEIDRASMQRLEEIALRVLEHLQHPELPFPRTERP